jgi:hypothetical protein
MINNYPIKLSQKYFANISKVIDNYQKMFGISAEVFRITNSTNNNYVIAYGKTQNVMSDKNYRKVMDVQLICYPQDVYQAYSQGSGGEIKVYTSKDILQVGDVIKFKWMNDVILEFTVQEIPTTPMNIYFEYTLKSIYQVKDRK